MDNNVHHALLEIESQSTEIQNTIQHLKSLLYFISEFFEYETLDADSPNENIRTHSYCMLAHYREYQSMFEIAYHKVCDLDTSAATLGDTLSAVFDIAREQKQVV